MRSSVFVLGPGEWRDPAQPWDPSLTPLEVRRAIACALEASGVHAFVMEDQPHAPTATWQDKFFHLLDEHRVTHVLFYWPPAARIDTAEDELILLGMRSRVASQPNLRVVLFGHPDAVTDAEAGGERVLRVGDDVGRSAYLGQVPLLVPTDVHAWRSHQGLLDRVQDWVRASFPDQIRDEALHGASPQLQELLAAVRREPR